MTDYSDGPSNRDTSVSPPMMDMFVFTDPMPDDAKTELIQARLEAPNHIEISELDQSLILSKGITDPGVEKVFNSPTFITDSNGERQIVVSAAVTSVQPLQEPTT